jgi:hypothetical protein
MSKRFSHVLRLFAIPDHRPESEIRKIAAFCHTNEIEFILTETRGVFGSVFVDISDQHVARDPSEEEPSQFLLVFIPRAKRQP